jgi:hypothetical protein
MKNIENYRAEKYDSPMYVEEEPDIYSFESEYVTSLSFEQEPELGEGSSAADISQYPLEDLLDKYYAYVSDFYEELNTADSQTCYLEFSASDIEEIRELRTIIGKHVYNKENGDYVDLAIE